MYKEEEIYYRKKKNIKKNYNKYQEEEKEKEKERHHNARIWDFNPVFKDVNLNLKAGKAVSLLVLFGITLIITYLSSLNIILSFISCSFIFVIFLAVFSDNFFAFRHWFKMRFRTLTRVDPFEDFLFWQDRAEGLDTIFINNKKDLAIVALKVFKIEVIPENIEPAVHRFM